MLMSANAGYLSLGMWYIFKIVPYDCPCETSSVQQRGKILVGRHSTVSKKGDYNAIKKIKNY
jgi:hypothetical protein